MDEQNKTTDIGPGKSLLLFQLGPVQDFIAQARSTRDLWSGSYMLSWLMAHAIKEIRQTNELKETQFVFPSLEEKANPLVFALMDPTEDIEEKQRHKTLIPNLPNKFLVIVPSGKENECAEAAGNAIREELKKMGDNVWGSLKKHFENSENWDKRWDAQIEAFPQITWAWTPCSEGETWGTVYHRVNQLMAARRNTRDFSRWEPDQIPEKKEKSYATQKTDTPAFKDSLSGKEEIIGDDQFWKTLRKKNQYFKTRNHAYGAMNLIKRLWIHVDDDEDNNYLAGALNFIEKEVRKEIHSVPSIPDIAAENKVFSDGEKTDTTDSDDALEQKKTKDVSSNGYVAVLAMDGDKMGVIASGGKTPSQNHQADVSKKLSQYALDEVKPIVAKYKGYLVYAGGDDVLAILPASRAIDCAEKLREAFKKSLEGLAVHDENDETIRPEVSCGIAVGHKNAPLQMLVKEAQAAEHRAKDTYGRAAVAFTIYKRSGEILEWGCKWDANALQLMNSITELCRDDKLSHRFPYALSAFLAPYKLDQKIEINEEDMFQIIQLELRHVISRQGNAMSTKEQKDLFDEINKYLESTKARLGDFINLFLVETFLNRAKGDN